ncbi:hypothetical protein CKO09_10280 [Chromatium weissei]|nr:hypothetical protein [Chromatium weissei]
MLLLKTIPQTQIELNFNSPLSGASEMRTRQLRGALGAAFNDDAFFHQHDPATGKLLYRYPHIQYGWRNGHGVIIGWDTAASQLLTLPWFDLELRLGEDEVRVADAAITVTQGQFGVAKQLVRYSLQQPVLLFNQENYQRYRKMNAHEQYKEQDRLLVANLLTAMRGLEVNFTERLYSVFAQFHTQTIEYKQQRLLGISGEIWTNAVLPNGFAFGHEVSHGFGVIHCNTI